MKRMRRCKYCGTEMPISAKRCPNCNKKVKHPVLTAFCTIITLFTLFLIIVIIATSESEPNTSAATTSEQVESKQNTEPEVETVLVDDDVISAEFLGFEDHPELEMFLVKLRVTNKTDQKLWVYLDEASVNDEMMQLIMSGVPLKILPEKKGANSFIFYYKQTSIESFDDVESVSFKIFVKNDETMADIENTEEITINR